MVELPLQRLRQNESQEEASTARRRPRTQWDRSSNHGDEAAMRGRRVGLKPPPPLGAGGGMMVKPGGHSYLTDVGVGPVDVVVVVARVAEVDEAFNAVGAHRHREVGGCGASVPRAGELELDVPGVAMGLQDSADVSQVRVGWVDDDDAGASWECFSMTGLSVGAQLFAVCQVVGPTFVADALEVVGIGAGSAATKFDRSGVLEERPSAHHARKDGGDAEVAS